MRVYGSDQAQLASTLIWAVVLGRVTGSSRAGESRDKFLVDFLWRVLITAMGGYYGWC